MRGYRHESGSGPGVSRRTVLRGVGAGVVGGASLASAGTGAAQYLDSDVELVDLRDPASAELPADDELLVFAHGWFGTYGVRGQTADLADSLATGGYEPDRSVAIRWDASTANFSRATRRSHEAGAALADLIEAHADEVDGTIHLAGHSLGGRVVLETLSELGDGYEIETVAPMGAAADGSTVTEGGRWYDGVANNAGAVRNYHSENDSTVGRGYGGWNDTALGAEGAPDGSATPENYVDVDVTADVSGHLDYTDNEAVGRDLADAIQSGDDGGSDGGDDGSDGDDGGSDDGCSWCWWR